MGTLGKEMLAISHRMLQFTSDQFYFFSYVRPAKMNIVRQKVINFYYAS